MPTKHIAAQELGLSEGLAAADETALFKWLVASFLFGKPIQQPIAEHAYRTIVEQHQRDTPRKLATCSQAELVRMLGAARYRRYDISTAERLVKLARTLLDEYAGLVGTLRKRSGDRAEFEQRLLAFEGIGPKTVEIFMREAAQGLFDEA